MGRYMRHVSSTPVDIVTKQQPPLSLCSLASIAGGLSCQSNQYFACGTRVEVHIPMLGQQARYPGVITRCRKHHEHYRLGIAFLDPETLFKARMAEQVCAIEHYRQTHSMSFDQAAARWIKQYAKSFPGQSDH